MSTAADCEAPQLLVVDCIAPLATQPPEAKTVSVRQIVDAPADMVSPTFQVDPPPPRA